LQKGLGDYFLPTVYIIGELKKGSSKLRQRPRSHGVQGWRDPYFSSRHMRSTYHVALDTHFWSSWVAICRAQTGGQVVRL